MHFYIAEWDRLVATGATITGQASRVRLPFWMAAPAAVFQPDGRKRGNEDALYRSLVARAGEKCEFYSRLRVRVLVLKIDVDQVQLRERIITLAHYLTTLR